MLVLQHIEKACDVTHVKWSHSYVVQKFNLAIWIQGPNFKLSAHAFTFTLPFSTSFQFVIGSWKGKVSSMKKFWTNMYVEIFKCLTNIFYHFDFNRGQNGKSSFLLHTTNDMNNDPLNHLMNLERWTTNKLVIGFSSLGFNMVLEA
jgi:hypothetical protein